MSAVGQYVNHVDCDAQGRRAGMALASSAIGRVELATPFFVCESSPALRGLLIGGGQLLVRPRAR